MQWLVLQWYRYPPSWLAYCLSPFALLYRIVISIRLAFYRLGIKKKHVFPVPIVIVGNITVGGVGKTPLVKYIVDLLRKNGYKPGIVSRGYKGKAKDWPQYVKDDSDPRVVGDEAVMLVQQSNCPMVVSPNRVQAVSHLLGHFNCNIVVSDDGLQHYALARDCEIAVIDGDRQLGNRFCIPVGPLREPSSRLKTVDMVVVSYAGCLLQQKTTADTYGMYFIPGKCYQINNPNNQCTLSAFKGKTVHAIAAIGNPERFFNQLKAMGIHVICHPYPDHYYFTKKDIIFNDDYCVLMTDKDAVKCIQFCGDQHWSLPITVNLPISFETTLLKKISK